MVKNVIPLADGSTKGRPSVLNDSNSGVDPPTIVEPVVSIVVPIGTTDGNSGSPPGGDPRPIVEPVVSIIAPIGKTDGNSGSPLPLIKTLLLPLASLSSAGRCSRPSANLLDIRFLSSFLAIALPCHEVSCFAELAMCANLDIASATILSFTGKSPMVRSN